LNAAAGDVADQPGWSWNLGGKTQSVQASGVLMLPQVKYDTVRNVKAPAPATDFSLVPGEWCTVEKSEFNGTRDNTTRPCHNHSYVPQDTRAPFAPSSTVDEHRSFVMLPGAHRVRDDNFIDHLRLVEDGPVGGPKHQSLLWVERPDSGRSGR
jgi:hypothetical protein